MVEWIEMENQYLNGLAPDVSTLVVEWIEMYII